jgi:hypothetical protein
MTIALTPIDKDTLSRLAACSLLNLAGGRRGREREGIHWFDLSLAALACARAASMHIDVNQMECNTLFHWVIDPLADTSLYPTI